MTNGTAPRLTHPWQIVRHEPMLNTTAYAKVHEVNGRPVLVLREIVQYPDSYTDQRIAVPVGAIKDVIERFAETPS